MVTVIHNGGYGYGASSDISKEGILKATEEAKKWAEYSVGKLIHNPVPSERFITASILLMIKIVGLESLTKTR